MKWGQSVPIGCTEISGYVVSKWPNSCEKMFCCYNGLTDRMFILDLYNLDVVQLLALDIFHIVAIFT